MSILVDSSVLAAGTAQHHPAFGECRQWLRSTGARTELAFTTHAVAELYSTFTHPRGMFRMTPREATLIIIRLRNRLRIVPLSGADYYKVLATAVGKHVLNGNVYDVLHAQAARRIGARRIATLNTKHFRQFWPPSQLIDPTRL